MKKTGRPKKEPGEVLVDLPSKVSPRTLEAVEYIASRLDRPKGWVARRLLLRGIVDYFRDVKKMRPEEAIQVEHSAAALIEKLEGPGSRLLNKPNGAEIVMWSQWEKEDTGQDLIGVKGHPPDADD